MNSMLGTLALLALQQQGFTTPPGGDTLGYWQQRVAYSITARLDEEAQVVRASGTLKYVNNSPDTLRELYVHQYLNAFRPGSKWSEADQREGRVRFQNLRDPDYAYERFTGPVMVGNQRAVVSYPGTPDSTVARIGLPAPLSPGDSVVLQMMWNARPSTLPRRQGRRGRHWDLAQWYPRVAPYDRGGWQYNALQPAGEFYGEFGDYDVTLVLREDQVVAATGVPVSGNPGWERARRFGAVYTAENAYGPFSSVEFGGGSAHLGGVKVVRFVARDVHHFAWSTSPDYRYEGGIYVRTPPAGRVRAWDTVAVHVLYQPGDDTTWGGGRVLQRTVNSLQWLERIFGRYAYPQMTVLHRIEGGGTEFPMMQMNGSPSQGLNLHEGGHVWAHGILANNEWRSGWLDEGLTSYQTEWAQGLTPQERLRAGVTDRFIEPSGYRSLGLSMATSRFDAIGLGQALADLEGAAEPIGKVAHEFRDFPTYNQMIYTRAQVMYGQLRDALGDSAWQAFLHDYYERWALKHVDERAMRGSAERVSGRDLRWFFDQWIRSTGVMDYALTRVRTRSEAGAWVTEASVRRRGEYEHPIAVGARTDSGWTIVRVVAPGPEEQTVRLTTATKPLEVRLDPHHFSWDWNRANDVRGFRERWVIDWPFLRQADRERVITAFRPMLWYSEPGGVMTGLRARSSYLDVVNRNEGGFAVSTRDGIGNPQLWGRIENPYFGSRPWMGWSAGLGMLDDVDLFEGSHEVTVRNVFQGTMRGRITHMTAHSGKLLPESWSEGTATDFTLSIRPRFRRASGFDEISLEAMFGAHDADFYHKQEASYTIVRTGARNEFRGRGYFGITSAEIPAQRALSVSAQDAATTFFRHWWRPRESILKQDYLQGVPLGGPALRGYHFGVMARGALGANIDISRVVHRSTSASAPLTWRLHGFFDGAGIITGPEELLVDAGVALSVAGRIFDRDVKLRLDAPIYVSEPRLAFARASSIGWRYLLTFRDIWPD